MKYTIIKTPFTLADNETPFEFNSEKNGTVSLRFKEWATGNVEIKLGTELKTVYFILHPICKYLNEKMK